MVSLERASKSDQTLLKHYSLKINRLRDTEKKKSQTRGSCQFLISYDYKKYPSTFFTINFFILFRHLKFLITRLTYFKHWKLCIAF